MKLLRYLSFLAVMLLLSGCKMALLDPKGMVAASEKHLLLSATGLMLLVVVPVILLTLFIAWKYRASNKNAKYAPDWTHSTVLETVCWAIPCVIIGILAVMTWVSSHKLDPYRPLNVKGKPLVIEAVALNWKWLFIYPEQGIASVNFVQIPTNVPVRFVITADAPMNSLEIPRLAGQIYAMTGMRTKLNLIANEAGDYHGFSANYSGEGFTNMKFIVRASSKKAFDQWLAKERHSPNKLTAAVYQKLTQPSENDAIKYYSFVKPHLFEEVITSYMKPEIQSIDGNDRRLTGKEVTGKRHA